MISTSLSFTNIELFNEISNLIAPNTNVNPNKTKNVNLGGEENMEQHSVKERIKLHTHNSFQTLFVQLH